MFTITNPEDINNIVPKVPELLSENLSNRQTSPSGDMNAVNRPSAFDDKPKTTNGNFSDGKEKTNDDTGNRTEKVLFCKIDCFFERKDEKESPMLKCVLCDEWMHFKCVNLSPKRKPGGIWACGKCENGFSKRFKDIESKLTEVSNLDSLVLKLEATNKSLLEENVNLKGELNNVKTRLNDLEKFSQCSKDSIHSLGVQVAELLGGAYPKRVNTILPSAGINTRSTQNLVEPSCEESHNLYISQIKELANEKSPNSAICHKIGRVADNNCRSKGNFNSEQANRSANIKKLYSKVLDCEGTNASGWTNIHKKLDGRITSTMPNTTKPDRADASNNMSKPKTIRHSSLGPPSEIGKRNIDLCPLKASANTEGGLLETILVTNCSQNTDVDNLQRYVKIKGIDPFSIVELKTVRGDRKSFLIKTKKGIQLMDPTLWPAGVKCSQKNTESNTKNVIWGTCEAKVSEGISAQPYSNIYVGNCDRDTEIDQLKTYISSHINIPLDDIKSVSLLTKNQMLKSRAFKIETSRKHDTVLLSGDSWPAGVKIRRFQNRSWMAHQVSDSTVVTDT